MASTTGPHGSPDKTTIGKHEAPASEAATVTPTKKPKTAHAPDLPNLTSEAAANSQAPTAFDEMQSAMKGAGWDSYGVEKEFFTVFSLFPTFEEEQQNLKLATEGVEEKKNINKWKNLEVGVVCCVHNYLKYGLTSPYVRVVQSWNTSASKSLYPGVTVVCEYDNTEPLVVSIKDLTPLQTTDELSTVVPPVGYRVAVSARRTTDLDLDAAGRMAKLVKGDATRTKILSRLLEKGHLQVTTSQYTDMYMVVTLHNVQSAMNAWLSKQSKSVQIGADKWQVRVSTRKGRDLLMNGFMAETKKHGFFMFANMNEVWKPLKGWGMTLHLVPFGNGKVILIFQAPPDAIMCRNMRSCLGHVVVDETGERPTMIFLEFDSVPSAIKHTERIKEMLAPGVKPERVQVVTVLTITSTHSTTEARQAAAMDAFMQRTPAAVEPVVLSPGEEIKIADDIASASLPLAVKGPELLATCMKAVLEHVCAVSITSDAYVYLDDIKTHFKVERQLNGVDYPPYMIGHVAKVLEKKGELVATGAPGIPCWAPSPQAVNKHLAASTPSWLDDDDLELEYDSALAEHAGNLANAATESASAGAAAL